MTGPPPARRRGSRLALAVVGLGVAIPIGEAATPLVVVAHPDASVSDVSVDELEALFLGQRTMLGHEPVVLAEFVPDRDAFYRTLLGMAPSQIDRHWIGVVFRGLSARPPRRLDTPAQVRSFVSTTPGALAFLPAQHVDGTVRVLSIDGMKATDPGYPLMP